MMNLIPFRLDVYHRFRQLTNNDAKFKNVIAELLSELPYSIRFQDASVYKCW